MMSNLIKLRTPFFFACLVSFLTQADNGRKNEFVDGFKKGTVSALLPVIGQVYAFLALAGNKFSGVGIGVQGSEALTNPESFVAGVLLGHFTTFSLYLSVVIMAAKRQGAYGAAAISAGPPAVVAVYTLFKKSNEHGDEL